MGTLALLPMAEPHIPALVALEQLCFSSPWSTAGFMAELANPAALFTVALLEDTVVGYMGLHDIVGEGYIANVATHPQYRRMGIANALVANALAMAKARGMAFLTLEVRSSNAAAIALYTAHGFTPQGLRPRFYTNPTEDAMIMTAFVTEGSY